MAKAKIPAIGIDLGTSYSCVGVWQNGKVDIIANNEGNRTTPSYVAFTDTLRLVGDAAKNQHVLSPGNIIFDAKRLIGRLYSDPKIKSDMAHWPFVVANDSSQLKILVECENEHKIFSAVQISSMVLTKMKETAENYLGGRVSDAVISVPACFNHSQRQATRMAGAMAGLNVLRIINEPTAAALAYSLEKNIKGNKNVLIFDLGGGTLDVSILFISDGSLFEVLSTAGDTHLGGKDFDNRIVNYLKAEFKSKFEKDISNNRRALQELQIAAECAKRTLSSIPEVIIDTGLLDAGCGLRTKISRATFEELCADLFQSIRKTIEKALQQAKLSKDDINEIVLVGGSTRMPKIHELLQNFFVDKKLVLSMNRDEAVAYGAAVQAAILSGDPSSAIQDRLLIDVTPLSLGIETAGGVMTKLVERDSRLPCTRSQIFIAYTENQPTISFLVFEGECSLAKENTFLGKFDLTGILPAPRGVSQIEVIFDLDVNSILHVSAKDSTTGIAKNLELKRDTNKLSKEDVQENCAPVMYIRQRGPNAASSFRAPEQNVQVDEGEW